MTGGLKKRLDATPHGRPSAAVGPKVDFDMMLLVVASGL
jgi:hypothetical protein